MVVARTRITQVKCTDDCAQGKVLNQDFPRKRSIPWRAAFMTLPCGPKNTDARTAFLLNGRHTGNSCSWRDDAASQAKEKSPDRGDITGGISAAKLYELAQSGMASKNGS